MKGKMILACFGLVAAVAVYGFDDECETPLSKEQRDAHWVACEGVAKGKEEAISNALKQGLAMVCGEIISAEDKAQSFFQQVTDGTNVTEVAGQGSESTAHTKVAGFVREYNVVSVVPSEEGMKAHLHARIINPRAGVDAVILVTKPEATTELMASMVKVGPNKSVSGREICNIVENALCGAIAATRPFRVCTTKDIAVAAANNELTDALVGAGMVPSSELMHAGQMLTCDYILSTRLEKIAYTKKLAQDKATKKFGQVQSMKVTLGLRLTNVRSGTSSANETLTFMLDNEMIKQMLAADEDADLLRGALSCIIQPLRTWIRKDPN